MTPPTEAGRRDGHKAMEKSLTAAKKVARRLAAGRKPKESENLSKRVAASRAIAVLESAESVLLEHKLDIADLRIHLVYVAGEVAGHIRLSDNPAEFFKRLDELEDDKVLFLGILGELRDHEAGDAAILRWVRPFVISPLAAATLTALRDQKGTSFFN